jgi:hypothetical protein
MYLICSKPVLVEPAIHYVVVRPAGCCQGGTGSGTGKSPLEVVENMHRGYRVYLYY